MEEIIYWAGEIIMWAATVAFGILGVVLIIRHRAVSTCVIGCALVAKLLGYVVLFVAPNIPPLYDESGQAAVTSTYSTAHTGGFVILLASQVALVFGLALLAFGRQRLSSRAGREAGGASALRASA